MQCPQYCLCQKAAALQDHKQRSWQQNLLPEILFFTGAPENKTGINCKLQDYGPSLNKLQCKITTKFWTYYRCIMYYTGEDSSTYYLPFHPQTGNTEILYLCFWMKVWPPPQTCLAFLISSLMVDWTDTLGRTLAFPSMSSSLHYLWVQVHDFSLVISTEVFLLPEGIFCEENAHHHLSQLADFSLSLPGIGLAWQTSESNLVITSGSINIKGTWIKFPVFPETIYYILSAIQCKQKRYFKQKVLLAPFFWTKHKKAVILWSQIFHLLLSGEMCPAKEHWGSVCCDTFYYALHSGCVFQSKSIPPRKSYQHPLWLSLSSFQTINAPANPS